jgi:hypothetical protein
MASAFGFAMPDSGVKRGREFTGYLQSRNTPETRSGYSVCSTRPSNREGFQGQLRGAPSCPDFFLSGASAAPGLCSHRASISYSKGSCRPIRRPRVPAPNRGFWLALAGGSVGCANTRLLAGFGKGTTLTRKRCGLPSRHKLPHCDRGRGSLMGGLYI